LGTARFGQPVPGLLKWLGRQRDLFHYLDEVLDQGGSAFDTAASYQLGDTERQLGSWCQARGVRSRVYWISKGCHPYPLMPHRLTIRALRSDLEGSLRRLRTDSIDLYLLHRDAPSAALSPILETLEQARVQGKLLAWGLSNWSIDRIQEMTELAKKFGVPGPAVSSPHFSLAEWNRLPYSGCVSIAGGKNRAARDYHLSTGLPVLAWASLSDGYLVDSASGRRPSPIYDSPLNESRRSRAKQLAVEKGYTLSQAALAYLFNQRFPVSAIVSTRRPEKLRENLKAATIQLSQEEVAWLESGQRGGANADHS
jgi:aryl-alcohol dehydrogenase-like predicted oxidoreductase